MTPYYATMPKFETATDVMAYLESRGETLEHHEHLPVQDAWDDDKWVCEVPFCQWSPVDPPDDWEPVPAAINKLIETYTNDRSLTRDDVLRDMRQLAYVAAHQTPAGLVEALRLVDSAIFDLPIGEDVTYSRGYSAGIAAARESLREAIRDALLPTSRTTRATQAADPSGPCVAPVARCARGSLKGQP